MTSSHAKSSLRRGMGQRSSKNYGHFGDFTSRVYQLPQARQMLARLTPQAAQRPERELQEPANFGIVKSFVLMGQQAGFDMESPEGMRAWVQAYNAMVTPAMATAAPTKKKVRAATKGTRSAQRRKQKRLPPQ